MADYDYIDTTGTIVPDTADTQALVEQEYRDVFGQDLIVTPNTPQGVLIAAEVTARQAVARNNATLANQINPNLAGGVFLDAIWALTGGQRLAATKSVIPAVTLTGVPGTLVPAGSRAQTAAGDFFASAADATIGALGTVAVNFIAEEFGPVPAAVAALDIVVSAVLGWETVTNPTAATPGQLEESDVAARLRRRNTLALQGVALPEAIISGLYDTEGVRSVQFRENTTGGPLVIDTIPMVAHSIYACVDGGTDADVAASILRKKSLGADMNGATVVNVLDAASGQLYEIKFDRPTPVPVLARVTVRNQGATADPVRLVQNAILRYARGALSGEAGFTVGGSVSPFELGGAVNRVQPGLYVQLVELSTDGITWVTVEIPILINQIATIVAPSITVIVL
jgi:hypothetical protein